MLLYFDNRCLNRPHDDQRQYWIQRETEAILSLLTGVRLGAWDMASSEVLRFEAAAIPDVTRRQSVLGLIGMAKVSQDLSPGIVSRAKELQLLGFKNSDALHLASAEALEVTVFLTTDDQLLNAARRHSDSLRVEVGNPSQWNLGAP